jgi:hypothetical protein
MICSVLHPRSNLCDTLKTGTRTPLPTPVCPYNTEVIDTTSLMITKEEINQFIDYVMEFYGPDGLYPMSANRTIIRKATNDIMRIAKIQGTSFCGDSIDRELVRDLMHNKYNLKFS